MVTGQVRTSIRRTANQSHPHQPASKNSWFLSQAGTAIDNNKATQKAAPNISRTDTFRHTYRSWLDDTGAPMRVQQKLMRHAQVSTTMNVYGNALMGAKREANSKMVNLPKEQRDQAKSVLRAAWKLDAKAGMARIRKLAEWLERDYPSAAASLLEGLDECFTINRLGLPPSLLRCLATTNIIESPHAGVRIRTRRVTHWQNGKMVIRWLASAFIRTEKRFNKIMGYRDLWTLEAILNDAQPTTGQVAA
jgi:hypothetical protein